MNLNKIDVALCFAFQQSEGPFKVYLQYEDKKEWRELSRSDIKKLSDLDNIISIVLVSPSEERRSLPELRSNSDDRRKMNRFI